MAKKPKIPEHENAERWMVSYADFMTLLFALFVVLYGFAMSEKSAASAMVQGLMESFSQTGLISSSSGFADDKKIIATEFLTQAMAAAAISNPSILQSEVLGGGGLLDVGNTSSKPEVQKNGEDSSNADSNKTDVEDSAENTEGEYQMGAPFDSIMDEINASFEDLVSKGIVTLTKQENWITIELNNALVFAPDSASVLNRAKPVLQKISEILSPLSNYVRVRGYTDNRMVHDEVYRSNWELSAARAISVINELENSGINPQRLALEGYGQYAPFVSNSTAKGRSKNRSVVIAISKYALSPKKLLVLSDDEINDENKRIDGIEFYRTNDGRLRIVNKEDSKEDTN